MITANITVQAEDKHQIHHFEVFLREQIKVIDFRLLPDTKKLYNEDKTFQRLVKKQKDARRVCDEYINKHNFNG